MTKPNAASNRIKSLAQKVLALVAATCWCSPGYCTAFQHFQSADISGSLRTRGHVNTGSVYCPATLKKLGSNTPERPTMLHSSSSSTQDRLPPMQEGLVKPDYLVTDSKELIERPTIPQFLFQPRNFLGLSVVSVGFVLTLYNVLGVYNDAYVSWEMACVALGLLNGAADFSSVIAANYFNSKPTRAVSPNARLGMADDALLHAYAACYTVASAWLAYRASPVAPEWLFSWDRLLGGTSAAIFTFSLIMPTMTLLHHHNVLDVEDKLKSVVGFARWNQKLPQRQPRDNALSLTDTELLRVRSLLIIGAIGCVFAPIALSFALGGQEWWGRVTTLHPSQTYLESTTELYGVLATQASMISHRAAKAGVAPLGQIVPLFTLVCFLLAVLPCVCSLYWLGNDISFFSFYRE